EGVGHDRFRMPGAPGTPPVKSANKTPPPPGPPARRESLVEGSPKLIIIPAVIGPPGDGNAGSKRARQFGRCIAGCGGAVTRLVSRLAFPIVVRCRSCVPRCRRQGPQGCSRALATVAARSPLRRVPLREQRHGQSRAFAPP